MNIINNIIGWLEINSELGTWAEAFASVAVIYLTLRKKRTFGFGSLTIDDHDEGHLQINNLYNTNNSARLIKIVQVPNKRYAKYIIFNSKQLKKYGFPHNISASDSLKIGRTFLIDFLSNKKLSLLEERQYKDYKYTDVYVKDGYHTIYKLRSKFSYYDKTFFTLTYKKITSYNKFIYYLIISNLHELVICIHNKIIFKISWTRHCSNLALKYLYGFISSFEELIKYYKAHKKDKDWYSPLLNIPTCSSWNNTFDIKFGSRIKEVQSLLDKFNICVQSISNNKSCNKMLKIFSNKYNKLQLPQINLKNLNETKLVRINIEDIFKNHTRTFKLRSYIQIFIMIASHILKSPSNKRERSANELALTPSLDKSDLMQLKITLHNIRLNLNNISDKKAKNKITEYIRSNVIELSKKYGDFVSHKTDLLDSIIEYIIQNYEFE